MRFEVDAGEGFRNVFPETFSFHAERHDPAEINLQLDDLAKKPQLLSPRANRRDAEILCSRLLLGMPRYLERLIDRLEAEGRLREGPLARVYEDVAILAQIVSRFLSEQGGEGPGIRMASFHLRKLAFRSLDALMRRRVPPEYLSGYVRGDIDPFDPADDLSESGFFYTMETQSDDAVHRSLVRLAERAFHRWLEDVCLDEDNRAFEIEGSPFADRETEVRRAVGIADGALVQRAQELSPFLRRPGNRDCLRVLEKLEAWFLHQYDIHHAAVTIQHADDMARDRVDSDRVLSRHTTTNYVIGLFALALPFIGAVFAYDRAPRLFDALCGAELVLVNSVVLWFLLYRFCWKKNLTFFHASVPRIAAGIIVGFLPIFFLDEVWGLAEQSWTMLARVALLLAFANLLYLYIEVQRRLGDPALAFVRARQLFMLGVVQSFGVGLIITGLVGGFMALRNWGGGTATNIEVLRTQLEPFAGELPRIVGFEPFYTFPPAIFIMTFLAFFIGTFLQLMWEDIPITEPL